MIRENWDNIVAGVEVRKNLIALKAECKEIAGKHALLYALNNDLSKFYELLKEEDPKIRKNAALILGQLGVEESLEPLYQAYEQEQTMFVKSSYLVAMKEFDYRNYLEPLKKRMEELKAGEIAEESKKHIQEEIRLLQELIVTMEGHKKHVFTGWKENSRVILLTNRNYQEITAEQMKSHRPKIFNAGVQGKTEDLEELYQIRTFSELLFVLDDCTSLKVGKQQTPTKPKEIEELAKKLAKQMGESSLLSFLEKRHKGDGPFYFRIECKNKMDLKQKSHFTKKLALYLQEETGDALLNSTSNYEVELRLIENKLGDFNFLIKLYTYKDPRFSYRREALSSSIQPVNAALFMELAKDYLTEGAQVLDPFCGVGTMLIERSRLKETGDLYGIDIFGKGIEAARRNTERAKCRVNYINRDFFDFTHAYLFDEVISNLPRVMGQKKEREIEELYQKFWKKIPEHIKDGAILLLYCYESELLLHTLPKQEFEILEEYEISKKEGAYAYVIKYNGSRA